ncbi:restriction endonuclease subunit S [Halobacteriovorax sp. HLS]|uniref:restriction endonuclease subunit S n=1 Tax=Halobacteriovorax sp. HLS TaxID=2234000 RepID=UPI000FDC52AE|nr:restriction endonuclease subunit S [Halobacteriovorax sp. HLS]
MSKFPADWNQESLKNFTTERTTGANFKPSEFTESGKEVIPKKGINENGILFIPNGNKAYVSNEIAKSYKKANIDGSFLVTVFRDLVPTGPSLGRIVKINSDKKYILAQGTGAFKTNSAIDTDYLIQFSNSDYFRREMGLITVGSTQVFVKGEDYYSVPIFYPSISEQKKIGKILTTVDRAILLAENEIDKLKNLKKGMMQDLFTKGIGHTQFKNSPIGKIPATWDAHIGKKFLILGGGPSPSSVNFKNHGDTLYIKVDDFNSDGNEDFIEKSFLSFDRNENDSINIYDKGTLVIAKRGAAILKNRVRQLTRKTSIDTNLMAITCKKYMSERFLKYYLELSRLDKLADTTSIPQINNPHLNEIFYPCPPKVEQEKIIRILDSAGVIIKEKLLRIRKLKNLKKGLMQDLLTGRVRVRV